MNLQILLKFSKCDQQYGLIILIPSDIGRHNERMVIRKTWGKWRGILRQKNSKMNCFTYMQTNIRKSPFCKNRALGLIS